MDSIRTIYFSHFI